MDKIIPYLGLGVLALIGAVIIYNGYYFKNGIYKRCTEKISARVTSTGGNKRRVVYEIMLDGKPVTFTDSFTTGGLYAPTVGETVELFYDPHNIEKFSYPKRSNSVAIFDFILGGLMVVLPVFGMIMYTVS
ncbi:MAG: hypothetical protein K2J80_06865 [Oscillospiraceae bacterium]|nr:hypothetical protein [Oscillospiraceae bacterium]